MTVKEVMPQEGAVLRLIQRNGWRATRNRRRWVPAIALSLMAAVFVPLTASAEPDEVDAAIQRVNDLHDEAEQVIEKYNGAEAKKNGIAKQLKADEAKVAKQRVIAKAAQEEYSKYVIKKYIDGEVSSMQLMLSDDPQDLLFSVEGKDNIYEQAVYAQTKMIREKTKLERSISSQQARLKEAESNLAEIAALNKEIKTKITTAENALARLSESQQRAWYAAAKDAGASCKNKVGLYAKGIPVKVRQVLDFACQQQGTWYKWGGNGPQFDCSGLTQQAFKRAKVDIPRVAEDQRKQAKKISKSELKPGDLVFFGFPATHVGINLGDGLMIHAPRTGEVVKVQDYTKRKNPSYGRYLPTA